MLMVVMVVLLRVVVVEVVYQQLEVLMWLYYLVEMALHLVKVV